MAYLKTAMLRNCILTNKEEVLLFKRPIYEQYKFEEKQKNLIKNKKDQSDIWKFEVSLKILGTFRYFENEESMFKSPVVNIFDNEKMINLKLNLKLILFCKSYLF